MYTKLFSSITDSTIWREPNHVRILWITMLAKCDPHGCVWASIPGIADAARLDVPLCQEALKVLESPDEWSRSKEEEGRRIKEIEGGWQLINHAKYKAIRSSEERREYKRLKQQEYRNKHKNVDKNVDIVHKVDNVDPSDKIRSYKKKNTPSSEHGDFLDKISVNPAFSHVNIKVELGKMDAWLSLHKGRKKTPKFVLNWLNRIEAPLDVQTKKAPITNTITPEEREAEFLRNKNS